jgi:hypothetical protein
MAQFYGMLKLSGPDAWKGLAGEDKWRATRSAYELAYAWHGAGGIPLGIRKSFDASGHRELQKLNLELGFVEKPVFLDSPIGPSMTDIMGYARNGAGEPVILAVEGKATESFGLPIRAWLRGEMLVPSPDAEPKPTRVRRLRFLAERLGLSVNFDSALYYQLLHRTVSAVLEGTLAGASAAVLVVHSFSSEDGPNWAAYSDFLQALGAGVPVKGAVSGPLSVPGAPDIKLFALWHPDAPRRADA